MDNFSYLSMISNILGKDSERGFSICAKSCKIGNKQAFPA